MRQVLLLSAIALSATLTSSPADAQYRDDDGYGGIVRCESGNGRWNLCPVDTRGGVELVRQLSRSACVRGRTWGDQREGIWVKDGCRGEFRVGAGGGWYGHAGDGRAFRCESDRGRARHCAVPGRGDVHLVRQLSSTPCIEGRTWGRDRGGVWVDRGCRAEFQWSPGRGWGRWHGGGRDGGYGGYRQTLRCESSDGRDRYCRADVHRGVQLQRQLSSAACIEGRTWGWDRDGVWVDRGCRGEFAIW